MIHSTTVLCPFSAGLDYARNTSKYLNFTGDSVHSVSIQIIYDSISEPSETFFGLLNSADGMTIPPNIHLEPTRATVTILNNNGSYNSCTAIVISDVHFGYSNLCRSHKVCGE